MKEQNNEILLWGGICAFIAVFIWQMPNIERLLFGRAKKDKVEVVKEEPKKEETPIKSGRVTCGASISDTANMEYILTYEDSKVKKVILTINDIHDSKDQLYKDAVEECNKVETRYANQAGFEATCTVNNLTITTKQQFDLKTFKDFTIDEGNGRTETVSLDLKLDENIESLVKELTASGATCK